MLHHATDHVEFLLHVPINGEVSREESRGVTPCVDVVGQERWRLAGAAGMWWWSFETLRYSLPTYRDKFRPFVTKYLHNVLVLHGHFVCLSNCVVVVARLVVYTQ